ncbi:MAG: hypothetical protein M0Q51_01340 [Bacteroidales bacterium]|nr:hypothetical protein [Bacteroidales bacterium]
MTNRILLTIWLFLIIAAILGQSGSSVHSLYQTYNEDSAAFGQNKLTIYVIPATVKYDWRSPRTLCKSFFGNFKRNFFKKEKYLLGHAFVELQTPLSSGRIFTGMRLASGKEQQNLVLKEHYGLAILGADTEGKLETCADLDNKVKKYSRKGQLAFMTFFISDEATERLLQFYQSYKAGIDSNGSRGARYGGAFWPRYKGEGSGCSAFVVSFLDIAGLLKEEFDEWIVKINIPMELIGGPYNNFNDVRLSDIKKHKSWAGNYNSDTASYEHFEIYDPTLIYEWIQEKWEEQNSRYDLTLTPLQLNQARGIRIDSRNQPLPDEESIFLEREKPSIFIDYYHQKFARGN